MITFFPGGRGLDPDLNISLAADGLTTRGDTFRNASVRDLFEFSERSSVKITSERALEVVAGPLAKAIKTTAYATDTFPGAKIMDVDEFEGRLASVRTILTTHTRAPPPPYTPFPLISSPTRL